MKARLRAHEKRLEVMHAATIEAGQAQGQLASGARDDPAARCAVPAGACAWRAVEKA